MTSKYAIEVKYPNQRWIEWEVFPRSSIVQARNAVKAYQAVYPHFKFRIVKVVTTREVVK